MEHCLLRKDGEFCLSRLDSYKKYLKVEKPMDQLINACLEWNIPSLTPKDFK